MSTARRTGEDCVPAASRSLVEVPMQCCPLAAWFPLARRLALAHPAVALAVCAAWAWSGSAPPNPTPSAEPPPAPFSGRTEPAKNPEQLLLLADGHQVVGWISGNRDHAGESVIVEA